jgi:phage RecT family recombinase
MNALQVTVDNDLIKQHRELLRKPVQYPLTKLESFKVLFQEKQQFIEGLLPNPEDKHNFPMKIEKLLRGTPELLNCKPETLFDCVYKMALTGLDPNMPNEIFAIPYKGLAQIQIGYKGIEKLALQHSSVVAISSQVVYTQDDFSIDLGDIQKPFTHKIPRGERGVFEAVYAQAVISKNGVNVVIPEYLTKDEVIRIKAFAQTEKFWGKHFDEMARKSAIKRLAKHLPVSNSRAMQAVLAIESANENKNKAYVDEQTGNVIEVESVSPLNAIRENLANNDEVDFSDVLETPIVDEHEYEQQAMLFKEQQ